MRIEMRYNFFRFMLGVALFIAGVLCWVIEDQRITIDTAYICGSILLSCGLLTIALSASFKDKEDEN